MISIVRSLLEDYISIPSFNFLILGTQETGKTVFSSSNTKRFFNIIKNINNLESYLSTQTVYTPTIGLNTTKFKTNEVRLCAWDLGGKKSIKKIWQNYYSESHGLIYFVNDRNQTAFEESLEVLRDTLRHNEMARIPVILLLQNNAFQQKLRRFIERQNDIFNREYKIQNFVFQQIGVLSDPSASIKRQQLKILELLKWLYTKILALDKQVKSYGLNDN